MTSTFLFCAIRFERKFDVKENACESVDSSLLVGLSYVNVERSGKKNPGANRLLEEKMLNRELFKSHEALHNRVFIAPV